MSVWSVSAGLAEVADARVVRLELLRLRVLLERLESRGSLRVWLVWREVRFNEVLLVKESFSFRTRFIACFLAVIKERN